VTEAEIRAAGALLFRRGRLVVEPTGAVAPAAALSGKLDLRGRAAVAIVSGGNVDPSVLLDCLAAP
jgi:threonine dehydratase